ncbi:MAG: transcription termination factor NusA [Lentisphaerae bacterium]|nr:transcription termination factor NusA [Lentisphaerota bacterium]
MANELLTILEYIERERGISRESITGALEKAIKNASHKSIHPASQLDVVIDPVTGSIKAYASLEVVEENPSNDQLVIDRARERFPEAQLGDVVKWEVTPRNFGRIAAQTARQAIVNELRKAEKATVNDEYAERVGQIINGTVRRIEGSNIIIDFGKAEGIMAGRDRIHEEEYFPGDHINALLVKVDINTSGPSLIVSRSNPDFVVRLFEREVSEIRDGLVKIMGIAREPGRRTKIAVMTSDSRIDPVGACVGVRGSRVRRITDELENERIDIVPYDEDIKKYAANALLPAKVRDVLVNEEKHELLVKVSDEQSRVAFGRKAQNIRLTAKLIGWNITLKNEDADKAEAAPEVSIEEKMEQAASKLAADFKVSVDTARVLVSNGFVTIDGIRAADPDTLLSLDGIDSSEIETALAELDK